MVFFSWLLGESEDTKLLRSQHESRGELINQLITEIETQSKAVDNLAAKVAEAAQTITTLRDHRLKLRNELLAARAYVLDTSDYIEEELETVSPRSKKRAPLEATLAAVNADLKKIADLLVETSK